MKQKFFLFLMLSIFNAEAAENKYVEFETGEQSQDAPDELSMYSELEIRAHQMMQIRDFVQSNKGLKPEEIVSEINVQIDRLRAMAEAILKQ